MIDGLDPDDARLERVSVRVEIAKEVELGSRRTDDEDLLRTFERSCDFEEKALGVVRVFLRARLSLRMSAVDVLRRGHRGFVELLGRDVEDPGFPVIDPRWRYASSLRDLHGLGCTIHAGSSRKLCAFLQIHRRRNSQAFMP